MTAFLEIALASGWSFLGTLIVLPMAAFFLSVVIEAAGEAVERIISAVRAQ
jgi:hypothetical protein